MVITKMAVATAVYRSAEMTTMNSVFESDDCVVSPRNSAVAAHAAYSGSSLRPIAGISYLSSLPNI